MNERADRRGRLIEIAVSVAASIFTSAVVVSWTMSATLEALRSKNDEQDRVLAAQSVQIQATAAQTSVQGERLAAADAHYQDILRRLDSIDRKLEAHR